MSSSAETVANIEGLLKQILISVPAPSLIRFKCVSKHWLSLISDPDFCRRHTLRNPNPKISAFFSSQTNEDTTINSITLGSPAGNPFKTLANSASALRILQSCNGLFLCYVEFPGEEEERNYPPVYVVNPTTNKFRALSAPSLAKKEEVYMFVRYGLAFDPSKSPHYTVVCVSHDILRGKRHSIEIYSSETGTWVKRFKALFFPSPSDEGRHIDTRRMPMHFDERSREGAVYCNGAIHWIRNRWEASLPFCSETDGVVETVGFERSKLDVLHYYDIGEESLRLAAATPPVPLVVKNIPLEKEQNFPTEFPHLIDRYFGESGGGCLYLIEVFEHCRTQFEVMEMERDYSGWFVKYHVDLSPVVAPRPGQDPNAFVVLFLSRDVETDGEDSSTDLWLHMPGKVVSYNLRTKSFKTSVELANRELFLALDDDEYEGDNYPYMETLACV
ncbi:putative F-box domain, galactose oxidase, beta-propeller [Rosa chinensis]|uniref:Putative F-box domain, galactose oxidase, beta-propeller n=1 Tax=Rosa chinensis TaxID=74649 RepID=A0A2P6QPN6_ROSCH|nr:F-box protein At5g07610 [Rosa chinensis]PRQ36127.1 putative F-box domain, galactose oxidase, beta-propeller [Rosa chinensis]